VIEIHRDADSGFENRGHVRNVGYPGTVPVSISLADREPKNAAHATQMSQVEIRQCLSPRTPIVGLRISGRFARRGMFSDNLGVLLCTDESVKE